MAYWRDHLPKAALLGNQQSSIDNRQSTIIFLMPNDSNNHSPLTNAL